MSRPRIKCVLRVRSSKAFWLMHWRKQRFSCVFHPTFSASGQWPACAADKKLLHLQPLGGLRTSTGFPDSNVRQKTAGLNAELDAAYSFLILMSFVYRTLNVLYSLAFCFSISSEKVSKFGHRPGCSKFNSFSCRSTFVIRMLYFIHLGNIVCHAQKFFGRVSSGKNNFKSLWFVFKKIQKPFFTYHFMVT